MKLQSKRNHDIFYVNWWLTDHCNYNCSYCPQELKRGEVPFLDFRKAVSFLDKIKAHCEKIKKTPQIELTGGEITEWSHLKDLLAHSKSLGFLNIIRTNGSKDTGYYTQILPNIDVIELIFHPEYNQKSHFMIIASLVSKFEKIDTRITLKCLPSSYDDCREIEKFVKSKWEDINVKMEMLFEDPINNTQVLKSYSKEQTHSFENQLGDLDFEYDNGTRISTDYQTLVLHKKNLFTSWNCMIGVEQIVVDAWGHIYRGHCRQGKSIGTIGEDIEFPETSQICRRSFCPNGFDIQATKFS